MFPKQCFLLVAFIAAAACQTHHGIDKSVCLPSTASTELHVAKPNISEQFHCVIEVVLKDKNSTELFEEYFDYINNRGYVRQKADGITFEAWFDYGTNEFIGFFPDAPASMNSGCYVTDLSKSRQRFMFGYLHNETGGAGIGHIFSAAAALHFRGAGINEIYKGRTTVRDVEVDWWQSCQYWNEMDATMIVDWYFTVKDMWDSAFGIQVPVQAHVQGVSYLSKKHNFDRVYNFYDFRPFFTAEENSVFETPSGVSCPGRKLTKPLPTLPTQIFSLTVEAVDMTQSTISLLKETFDFEKKFVMYEYRSLDPGPYGLRDLIEIHDFNTGVAYIKDKVLGNCTAQTIENVNFDVKSIGPHSVRMRTVQEFFYFDVSGVSYEGVKLNRKIECDTWVARRSDWPSGSPQNSTWEWYFATENWIDLNKELAKGDVPIQIRVRVPDINMNFNYNIFNLRKNTLDLLKFDISACYNFKQRRSFQLSFRRVSEGSLREMRTNTELLSLSILKSVTVITGLSSLRVTNIRLNFNTTVTARFELLDVAPIFNNTNTSEVPLSVAVNQLLGQIKDGQFNVRFTGQGIHTVLLVADPNKAIEITPTSTVTSVSTTTPKPSITKPATARSAVTSSAKMSSNSSSVTALGATSTTKHSVASSTTNSHPDGHISPRSSVSSSTPTSNSKHSAVSPTTSARTGDVTTRGTGKINGYVPQAATDKTSRTLSIVGVVLGSVIIAILAVLLVLYLKKSGRIRVPGQRNSAGFENVAFNNSEARVNLQAKD